MSNPFVYYRLDSIKELKHDAACAVHDLDWHKDLAAIQKFYARFTDTPINPDEFDQTVGSPSAIMDEKGIISFAIPLSFREGETQSLTLHDPLTPQTPHRGPSFREGGTRDL